MRLYFLLLLAIGAFLTSCSQPTTPETATVPVSEIEHVVLTHSNNSPKLVYRYAGTDSLNRIEIGYHETGEQMTIGKVESGQRHGEWNSFHPDGKPWSTHYYDHGKQEGLYRVYFSNGQPRIQGQYNNDQEVGIWHFFAENGDTVRTINYDLTE